MQMLGTGANALQGIAARPWGFFGFRFGKSGRDRISMDRGSAVENFGARWAEIEDGDGRDFRLRLPRLLTRTYCSLAQTRSLASIEWLVWQVDWCTCSSIYLAAFLYLYLNLCLFPTMGKCLFSIKVEAA